MSTVRQKPDLSSFKKVLFLRTLRIGGMLISTPAIRAVRQALPDARLDIVCAPSNYSAIQGNPHINDIFIFDLRNPLSWPKLLHTLRKRRYDAALTLNSSSRSTSLLTRLIRAQESIAFGTVPRYGNYYSWVTPPNDEAHVIMDLLVRLESLGIPTFSNHMMDFFVPEEVAAGIHQQFPVAPGRRRLAIFVGNIKKPLARWPIEKFITLTLSLLQQEENLDIVILGGKLERPLLSAFSTINHPSLTFFEGGTLQESAAFLQSCCALVAGSSGPTHLAASQGIPVLSIASWGLNNRWGPLGKHCASVTPDNIHGDMREIPVEPVLEMVRRFLAVAGTTPSNLL